MERIESVSDMRRKAPLHFLARADNAKASAEYLWEAPSRGIALHEGFCREAGVALELIIKAMIAQHIEAKRNTTARPPDSHELLDLWSQAKLPSITKGQKLTLLEFGRVLKWAGRYPAPLKDEEYDRYASQEEALLEMPSEPGRLRIKKLMPLTWERFIEVYDIAIAAFWRQRYLDRPWEQADSDAVSSISPHES